MNIHFVNNNKNKRRLMKKNGMFWHFVECDNRMWRIGERQLPLGLQFDGASDWICLHHTFVAYLIDSNHTYLRYLKRLFDNSIMAPEVVLVLVIYLLF